MRSSFKYRVHDKLQIFATDRKFEERFGFWKPFKRVKCWQVELLDQGSGLKLNLQVIRKKTFAAFL